MMVNINIIQQKNAKYSKFNVFPFFFSSAIAETKNKKIYKHVSVGKNTKKNSSAKETRTWIMRFEFTKKKMYKKNSLYFLVHCISFHALVFYVKKEN